jgi:hypothetical protein
MGFYFAYSFAVIGNRCPVGALNREQARPVNGNLPREPTSARRTPVVLALVAGLTLLGACSQPSDTQQSAQQPAAADRQARKDADEKAWAEAEKTGTVAAFTTYLQNFGSGAHVAEASRRIVALIEQARKEADDKAWADAEKIGTAAAFTAYIQNFSDGAHVAEARQRVLETTRKEADEKAWTEAQRVGTATAFNAYLQNFSSGAHAAEARQRVLEATRKEADEKAWTEAQRVGTATAFNSYLQSFSSGAHAAEARRRAAALDAQGPRDVERGARPRKDSQTNRTIEKTRHRPALCFCECPGDSSFESAVIQDSRISYLQPSSSMMNSRRLITSFPRPVVAPPARHTRARPWR